MYNARSHGVRIPDKSLRDIFNFCRVDHVRDLPWSRDDVEEAKARCVKNALENHPEQAPLIAKALVNPDSWRIVRRRRTVDAGVAEPVQVMEAVDLRFDLPGDEVGNAGRQLFPAP